MARIRFSNPVAVLTATLFALSACDGSREAATNTATATVGDTNTQSTATITPSPEPAPAASSMPMATPAAAASSPVPRSRALLSCSAEIGAAAAARRVAVCRDVSPATHPPCNAVNSCAMIEDEIARSCALFDGKGAPMRGCSPAPKGMAAAAAVVQRYYSAINAHDYATAWTQWGDDGRPGQTLADFEKGFAHTRSTRVTIGAMEPGSGGAGSIYQPVPVTVEAVLDDGRRQRFRGSYVVRRVNDIDGATAAQLRWHLDSATLAPVAAR